MIPTKEQIEEIACLEQRSNGWHKARLGCITGSKVSLVTKPNEGERAYKKALLAGPQEVETKSAFNRRLNEIKKESPEKYEEELAKGPLKESEEQFKRRLKTLWEKGQQGGFCDTTMSYIYELSAQRNIRDAFLNNDFLFEQYLERNSFSSRDIRWGEETEGMARIRYSQLTGNEVVEIGFIRHDTVDWFGDSPDGLVVENGVKPIGSVEIKCPKSETWIKYKHRFNEAANKYNEYVRVFMEEHPEVDSDSFNDSMLPLEQRLYILNAEALKSINMDYYWQCQSHCECNKVNWCDFIVYDPMQKEEILITRIYRNDEDIDFMLKRIEMVNDYIKNEILV